jgi:hypothetical protein
LHGNRHCCPVTKFQQKNSKGIMMEIFWLVQLHAQVFSWRCYCQQCKVEGSHLGMKVIRLKCPQNVCGSARYCLHTPLNASSPSITHIVMLTQNHTLQTS